MRRGYSEEEVSRYQADFLILSEEIKKLERGG